MVFLFLFFSPLEHLLLVFNQGKCKSVFESGTGRSAPQPDHTLQSSGARCCLEEMHFLSWPEVVVYLFIFPVTTLNDSSSHFLLFPHGSALEGTVRRKNKKRLSLRNVDFLKTNRTTAHLIFLELRHQVYQDTMITSYKYKLGKMDLQNKISNYSYY